MAYTTIDKPSDYFETVLWSSVDTSIDTLDFQPDWVWIKSRTNADTQVLFDSVRGAGERLSSSSAGAESTKTDELTAFNSDGFTLGTGSNVNRASNNNVAWSWKETADAGFDIVSYTGNATIRTISHSLSAVPNWMIIKCRSEDGHSWKVYHKSIGATKTLALQGTGTPDDDANYHNDTEPTSSVFTVGSNGDVNDDGETFIAYLFAEKQGYSKFGSYIANANANGIFEYTGFKPAFLLIKNTSQATDWIMYDNKREGYEPQNKEFRANTNAAERNAEDNNVQFCANGFKVRNAGTKSNADSGDNLIYIAFAEQPLVTSTGIPATAR
jgi:hypothetical protein